MKVGDLVRHRNLPECIGILTYVEDWKCHVVWFAAQPTHLGAKSKHDYRALTLLSEA